MSFFYMHKCGSLEISLVSACVVLYNSSLFLCKRMCAHEFVLYL